MASQMYGVSGVRRRPRTYVDQINIQRQYLPQIIQQKAQKAYQDAQIGLQKDQLGLDEQRLAETARSNAAAEAHNAATLDYQNRYLNFEKESSEKQLGAELLKTGFNMAGSMAGGGLEAPSFLGKWGAPVKNAAVGTLVGFGAGKLLGGKNKWKKAAAGAGAGLLTSFLSGGNDLGSMAAGGASGVLGSLFG